MITINSVCVCGHLGQDAETKATSRGGMVCNFSLATKEMWKAKEDAADWHRIVAWDELAILAGKLKKGDAIMVLGRLQTRTWDKNGEKRYTTEIVATHLVQMPEYVPPARPELPKNEEDLPF